MAENIDMNQLVNLTGVGKIRDWVRANFLLKTDAEKMMASKLRITFDPEFVGQTYTVTGGENETYSGVVPQSQIAEVVIKSLGTSYSIDCASQFGLNYTRVATIGNYYGIYPCEVTAFIAYLVVTAEPLVTITATNGIKTYTSTTNGDGLCTMQIGVAGTFSVTASANENVSKPRLVEITENGKEYPVRLPTCLVKMVSWSDGTDAEIAAMLDGSKRGGLDLQLDGGWSIGDVRTITTNEFKYLNGTTYTSQKVDIVISSFDDYNSCGCRMQFDFKNTLAQGAFMNTGATTEGGYRSSFMFGLLANLANALPEWLSSRLITFSVLASSGHPLHTVESVPENKLALRSEVEVKGTTSASKVGEGRRIPYYTTSDTVIKKKGKDGVAWSWWTRSAQPGSSGSFCNIVQSGSVGATTAANVQGISPFGCL